MRILGALAAGLSLLLLPTLAAAQDFPSKPIKLIVPFPAGGPNDIIARVVGQRMSEITKQPIIIDNRGGQGGVLGTDAVAKAPPDGYTIGIVSASSLVINPTMERVPYNVNTDFAPITLVTTVPEMLVVASDVPAKNMGELVALAKAQPGKLNFASAGVGGLPHLAGELLKLTANIDIVHIPYRGAGPSITGLLAGDIEVLMDTVVVPHVQSGKLIGLAAAGEERLPELPDLPTLAEAGYSNVRTSGWTALFGPGPLPKEIIDIYARNIEALFKDETFVKRIVTTGSKPAFLGPAAFADYVRQDNEYFGRVIRELKIKGQD